MRTFGDPTAALEELAREDPGAAAAARVALGVLTNGDGLATVSQLNVQRFLWYELPTRFGSDAGEHRAVATALGRLLEMLGMLRYAALCRSATTDEVMRAYRHSDEAGLKACDKAMRASGVVPPSLPELTWGVNMGAAEVSAYHETAAALELALAVGDLRVGSRGWRGLQQRVALDHLTRPRHELDGVSYLQTVQAERISEWARSRGEARAELAGGMAPVLFTPEPPPLDAGERLSPFRWLLDAANSEAGIPLTQNGNLGRAIVQEACARYGWWELSKPPRTESDVPEVCTLHELLVELRAVRRSGRRLVLTIEGRRLAADDSALWRAVTSALTDGNDFAGYVQETALMTLLNGSSRQPVGDAHLAAATTVDDLAAHVSGVLSAEGWRDSTGDAPDLRAVRWPMWELWRRLIIMSAINDPFRTLRRHDDELALLLTPAGEAAARAALRARALRPR